MRFIKKKNLFSFELIGGIVIITFFLIIALIAPIIASPVNAQPYRIPKDGYSTLPKPPGQNHPLGTLPDQYDIFYGLIWGTRSAFAFGLLVVFGRSFTGICIGLISGYAGGWIDQILMRITDSFLAFPVVAIIALMIALFGTSIYNQPQSANLILGNQIQIIVISVLVSFGWMQYARLIRGNVISENQKEYILAAKSIGATHRRLIIRHLLPNSIQGLFVIMASEIGNMVGLIATFYFIGLDSSLRSDMIADWGVMLTASRDWVIGMSNNAFKYWYTFIPMCVAIVFFSIGWNLLGEGLRKYLDPRMR